MTVELLACPNPWCEAAERAGDYSPAVRLHHFGSYRVVCTSCMMEGPLQPTKDEAIAAWNTRSSLEGVAGPVEALEAAGAKFREYEQMHEAKIRPPFRGVKWSKQIASENMAAGEKAARNRDMAEMCEAALATFREQGGR